MEKTLQGIFFDLPFLWKAKNLSTIVGTLSTMLVKKAGLGLLNLVTSVKKGVPKFEMFKNIVDSRHDKGRRVFQR